MDRRGAHYVLVIAFTTQAGAHCWGAHTHAEHQAQALTARTPTDTRQAVCTPRLLVPRGWQVLGSRPVPLALRLTIHSLVIGGNLIPILPANHRPAAGSHQSAPATRAVRQRACVVGMGFTDPECTRTCTRTNTHTHKHAHTAFLRRTCTHRLISQNHTRWCPQLHGHRRCLCL